MANNNRVTMTGVDKLFKQLRATFGLTSITVKIKHKDTQPVYPTVRPDMVQAKPKSAKQNAISLNKNLRKSRMVIFWEVMEEQQVIQTFVRGAERIIARQLEAVDVAGLKKLGEEIGDKIIKIYQEHILNAKAIGGMAPLSKGYSIYKKNQYGDKPILVRSGQLLHSFDHDVDVKYDD